MKKLYTLLTAVILTANVFAQAPAKMSYQAVVRGADNELVSTQAVGMQISILQGSASGDAVYVETQTPSSNANGLVSLEIGTGATSNDFSAIDWSLGSYYIKTETDPTGGSNYTITGTNQLISVPYALYAATSGSGEQGVAGDKGEQGEKGEKGDQGEQGVAGDKGEQGEKGDVGSAVGCELSIGQTYQGGKIFYLDASGCHGLISAEADQSSAAAWGSKGNVTNAIRDGIGAGELNTERIISSQGLGAYASQLCANYQEADQVYGDWYLPSKYELNLLYEQRDNVGGFSGLYWSSTEQSNPQYSENRAWGQSFDSQGLQYSTNEKDSESHVRAIRAF
jgi:hypothetical protein